MIESHLGLDPWDVFHQGLARRTGLSFGTVTIVVGVVVLLLWIPLRQRPGLGTVSNVIVIGLVVDLALWLVPTPDPMWVRIGFLVSGIVLNAFATGLYIGARLGPGRATADDRVRGTSPARLDPAGPHRGRGDGAGARLAARRCGRARHDRLRPLDRPADPGVPAAPDGHRARAGCRHSGTVINSE